MGGDKGEGKERGYIFWKNLPFSNFDPFSLAKNKN